jgi:hypothetical protein
MDFLDGSPPTTIRTTGYLFMIHHDVTPPRWRMHGISDGVGSKMLPQISSQLFLQVVCPRAAEPESGCCVLRTLHEPDTDYHIGAGSSCSRAAGHRPHRSLQGGSGSGLRERRLESLFFNSSKIPSANRIGFYALFLVRMSANGKDHSEGRTLYFPAF